MRLARVLTAALLVVLSSVAWSDDEEKPRETTPLGHALEAHERGDYDAFYGEMKAVYAESPDDPTVIYDFACANALLGRVDDAVQLLGKLADAGVPVDPRFDRDFDPIRGTPQFRDVLKRLLAPGAAKTPSKPVAKLAPATGGDATPAAKPAPPPNAPPPAPAVTKAVPQPAAGTASPSTTGSMPRPAERTGALGPAAIAPVPARIVEAKPPARSAPLNPSRRRLALPDPEFLPSAIAFEPATRRLFVSSARQRGIVIVDQHGNVSDFIRPGADGFPGATGLGVDTAQRELWAACASEAGALLFRWDLVSGALRGRYGPPDTIRPHRFGAVAVAPLSGTVYVADELAGTVYQLVRGETQLVPLFPSGVFDRPQGLAFDEKRGRLYVAQSSGLEYVDLVSRVHRPVGHDRTSYLEDIAGLVPWGRDLLAVQPLLHRVILVDLDRRGDRASAVRVLEEDHPLFGRPVLGAVVDDELVYVANSNLDAITPDGSLRGASALPLSIVLELPLK